MLDFPRTALRESGNLEVSARSRGTVEAAGTAECDLVETGLN